uniref:TACC_C domain-containing protein n=1 Tax=Loa loa TaxID=7209 RepID=A0A1I7VR09_LOALO
MSSSHSDSSTEIYAISRNCSTCDGEETDGKSLEEPIQAEKQKRRLTFVSVKAADSNESNNADLPDENVNFTRIDEQCDDLRKSKSEGITIAEMTIVTDTNLLEILTNKTIQLNGKTDISNQSEVDVVSEACSQNNSRQESNARIFDRPVTTNTSFNALISEFLLCKIPLKQALFKPFSSGILSKASSKTTDPSSCAIVSNVNSIQLSPVQLLPAEPTHTPSQNIESKSAAAAPQVQVQQSFPSSSSKSSKTQTSPPIPAQTSSETLKPDAAQIRATIPEALDNLVSIPSKNSTIHNYSDEVILGGTATGTPRIPKTVKSGVMERNNSNEIVAKEQEPNKTAGMLLMAGSEMEKLESMEMSLDTVPEERQNFIEGISYKIDEPKPTITQFETPRRPTPSIDSRTITRPSKMRAQQLPEATITPFSKTDSESTTADILATNTGQPLPPASVTGIASDALSQPPQILGQQSATAPRSQIIQQALPQRPMEQQITTSNSVPQQISIPKITQLEQQQQPTTTVAPMRIVTQPTVVPPNIIPCIPVNINPAIVPNVATAQSHPHNPENPQRGGRKSSQRVRQRTVTVQSQVSLDITAAYNEVKQMNSDDPAAELVRRVQAIVATREKEWTAKNEKLTQLLAHEQKRNEPLEQKAAERLLAMAEYEKLVQEFVEELKKKNSDEKNCLGESKSVGRPGPEGNLSPDDVTQLLKERDQLAEEVNSLETSYSELFRRYEKLRQTSVEIKRNEDIVKSASEEMARRYSLLVEKFEMLRRNAEEQLDLANSEIERLIKQHEADTLGLRLKVKHQESKIDSLTVSLEARQKELESMTAIFEEVITKAEANDTVGNA